MTITLHEPPVAVASTWTVRVALFSVAVVGSAVLLHRIFGMATPVALNLFALALSGAVVSILLGTVALADVWRRGASGVAPTLFGMLVGAGLLAWPLSYLQTALTLPELNDVTTDATTPPNFVSLAVLRGEATNGTAYNGERFGPLQKKAYPDIRPFVMSRSVDDAFEIAVDAVTRGLKFNVVAQEAPDRRTGRPGRIEAIDRTLVVGFYDDVVLRIEGDQTKSRIDIRSASRVGRHDLGRNAQRVRHILNELQKSFEQSIPGAAGSRLARNRGRIQKVVPKRPKEADQTSAARRKSQDRAR